MGQQVSVNVLNAGTELEHGGGRIGMPVNEELEYGSDISERAKASFKRWWRS